MVKMLNKVILSYYAFKIMMLLSHHILKILKIVYYMIVKLETNNKNGISQFFVWLFWIPESNLVQIRSSLSYLNQT